ncbi:uncharacterized protein LOC105187979 [Harpegnathos saltator]|uniref:Uncharacterized protein n=1 Tax=Harpegnathos saltator TaxID=610380 RepID=E2B5M0_HARSA|nr:uncharacterized protein LOC105187979 [Harpegnathos saltator]EFN88989.1 hypothetical protein EAI_11782 [Harpegnathos saltator]
MKTAPITTSIASDATVVNESTSDAARPQQKRPLPPPLPPPPQKCRRNKSRSAETCQPQCDTASCPTVESVANEYRHRDSHTDIAAGVIEAKSPRSRDATSTTENRETETGGASDDPIPGSIATSKVPFLAIDVASEPKSPNKYPSLFFTKHDFQNVMSAMWTSENTSNASLSSAEPWREPSSREKGPLTTCMPDNGNNNDHDDVCFRVTTTNLPFEKCLERRKSPFDDEFVLKLEDYRFEDNIDGNTRMNDGGSFGHDIFDINENSDCRVGTKVRFVIESPSSSSRVSEFNTQVKIGVPCESSRSSESIWDEEQADKRDDASSFRLFEIQDERADVKNKNKRKNNSQEEPCTPPNHIDENNRYIAAEKDDPFTSASKADAILRTRYDGKDNDVNCEEGTRKGDFNSTSRSERVAEENRKIGEEKIMALVEEAIMSGGNAEKQADQSQMLDATSEIAENTYRFTDKSSGTVRETDEADAAEITSKRTDREEVFLKKARDDVKEKPTAKNEKIFISESLRNVLSCLDDDNVNPDDSDDDDEPDERLHVDDPARESRGGVSAEESRRLSIEENKETSGSLASENNRELISLSEEVFAKNVPVKVRRDSFLETMLLDDSIDCAIIAAAIPSPVDVDKNEASIPSEIEHKAWKSDTEIARESGRSGGLNNGATKVHAENENVSRDSSETKEKIAVVSTADVRSTQSENKSAGDAKNDVLNELLCNFSNIKLKLVSPEMKKTQANTQAGDDESMTCPIAIDNRTVEEREKDAALRPRAREKSRDQVRGAANLASAKTISTDADDNATIAGGGEGAPDMKRKVGSQHVKSDNRDPVVGEEITRYKNTETAKLELETGDVRIAKETSAAKTKIAAEESVDVKSSNESCANASTTNSGTPEAAESVGEVKPPRGSRDTRAPKTILKKTSVQGERRANESQKRIPIGAPTTMNKIFDSREHGAITCAPRNNSQEDGRKREEASGETLHGLGDEKKTDDEIIADDMAEIDRGIATTRPVALALADSGDKCAIVRKTTSVTPCNNNDNNRAATPVAVSNDQSSRDVVTITPGKVRSFVKYYEIRGDTTTEGHSKTNDSEEELAKHKSTKSPQASAPTVAARRSQRPEVTTKRREERAREGDGLSKSNDLLAALHGEAQLLTFASRLPKSPHDSPARAVCKSEVTQQEYREDDVSCVSEIRAQHTKASAKKSVQFLGGFTVIQSKSFDEDESAGIVAGCNASSSRKRRAPGIPPAPSRGDSDGRQGLVVREITKSEELPNAEKSSFQRREAAAQVHAGVTGHEENSGINRFVPKPETPQLVFYCTV